MTERRIRWRRASWTLAGLWLLGVISSQDWTSLRDGLLIGSLAWLVVNRRALRLPHRRPLELEHGPSGGGGELVSLAAARARRRAA